MYIDENIKLNFTLPAPVHNIIQRIEKYDNEDEWMEYGLLLEELDTCSKSFFLNGKITERQYNKILEKYGGI